MSDAIVLFQLLAVMWAIALALVGVTLLAVQITERYWPSREEGPGDPPLDDPDLGGGPEPTGGVALRERVLVGQ